LISITNIFASTVQIYIYSNDLLTNKVQNKFYATNKLSLTINQGMGISASTINAVKDRVEIEEIVSDFVTLKRKGKNLWACCPFHDEKTPSFSVAPDKGFYKCFGCGVSGDAIKFIMELQGMSYPEAIRHLATKYGIEIVEDEQSPIDLEKQNERDSLYIVSKFARDYFVEQLWETEAGKSIGLSYFRERGYNEKTIKDFELGYSQDSWDGLMKKALVSGHSEEILEKAGLIIVNEEKKYDRFRGRVIFPIHNQSGKVIAFGARTLQQGSKQAKYINSPETEIYHKSYVLYGLYQGKQAIRQQDNCYLVEGYTDVISMHLSDVPNVVASSGTSLTTDQIKLIGRYTKNITVLFDGDKAGIKASLRGIDLLLEGGLNVKAVAFDEGEDPDSYSRKVGSTAFREYLDQNSKDFLLFKLSLFAEETRDDPVKKAEAIKDIIGSIAKIPDALKRTIYIQESSKLLDIEEEILTAEANKRILQDRNKSAGKTVEQEILPETFQKSEVTSTDLLESSIDYQERESVRLLLNYSGELIDDKFRLYEMLLGELDDIEFSNPVYREILMEFRHQLDKGSIADSDHFIKHGSENVRAEVIDMVSSRYELSENWEKKYHIRVPEETEILKEVLVSNILRLKSRMIKKMIHDNLEEMKGAEDEKKQVELMKLHGELKKNEMVINQKLGNVINK
jgi:DNA primase